ncbi:MAG TPA: outer membrane beta-barrel protein [Edaphobacter sp.]
MKRIVRITSIALFLWTAAIFSRAQAVPTATRNSQIQVGAGWSWGKPDFGPKKAQGISFYGDYDFTRHIGIEGDVHMLNIVTPTDIVENSYLIGPRYVFHFRRFQPYAKGLVGLGHFKTTFDAGSGIPNYTTTRGIYAFGGGVDVRATRHLNVRAVDFEYQKWSSDPYFYNGLSPWVLTFGAAYRFH